MSKEIPRGESACIPKIMRTEHDPAQGALVFTKGQSYPCAQRTLLKGELEQEKVFTQSGVDFP